MKFELLIKKIYLKISPFKFYIPNAIFLLGIVLLLSCKNKKVKSLNDLIKNAHQDKELTIFNLNPKDCHNCFNVLNNSIKEKKLIMKYYPNNVVFVSLEIRDVEKNYFENQLLKFNELSNSVIYNTNLFLELQESCGYTDTKSSRIDLNLKNNVKNCSQFNDLIKINNKD